MDSPVVLVVVLSLYVIFLLAAALAHRADRRDAILVWNQTNFSTSDLYSYPSHFFLFACNVCLPVFLNVFQTSVSVFSFKYSLINT